MVIIASIKYSGHIESAELNMDYPAIANKILEDCGHPYVSALFIDSNEHKHQIDLAIMNAEDADEIPAATRQLLTDALHKLIIKK